jgi:F-type H+-transporting ATPase subunit b
MPQLDHSTFSSQLFWLSICFGLFYFSMSKIFLPKIRDILKDRHNNISNNNSIATQVQNQIDEITNLSKTLKETSISEYKLSIDKSSKEANLYKEQSLSNLKVQIIQMIDDSKNEIKKFKQNSQGDIQATINDLADKIGNKFFNNKI